MLMSDRRFSAVDESESEDDAERGMEGELGGGTLGLKWSSTSCDTID